MECLGAIPDNLNLGITTCSELAAIIAERGRTGMIVNDNGTEFICESILESLAGQQDPAFFFQPAAAFKKIRKTELSNRSLHRNASLR